MTDTKPRIGRFDDDGRPLVSSSAELAMALAAGFGPEKIAFADNAAAIAERAAGEQRLVAERAAGEQRLAAEREAWAAERATLVDQALRVQLPEQNDAMVQAERTRILSIQKITQRGFEAIAQQAIESGINVEQFALAQLTERADRGITLDAIRSDAPPPASHAAPPPEPGDRPAQPPGAFWDRAFAKARGQDPTGRM